MYVFELTEFEWVRVVTLPMILQILVDDLANTEGTFSKIWTGLRTNSWILKTWILELCIDMGSKIKINRLGYRGPFHHHLGMFGQGGHFGVQNFEVFFDPNKVLSVPETLYMLHHYQSHYSQ